MTEKQETIIAFLPLTDEEKEVIEPRDAPTMDVWAESEHVLDKMTSKIDGPYSLEYTPFLLKTESKALSATLCPFV